MSEATARTLYFAHVARSLALEIRQDLPWSLCDSLATISDSLLPSRHYNFPAGDAGPPGTVRYRFSVAVTPAHPTVTYAFLVDNDLIGATRFAVEGADLRRDVRKDGAV